MIEDITGWFSDLFSNLWNSITQFVRNLIDTLFDVFKDVFFWIIDTVFDFLIAVLDSVGDGLSQLNPAQYIAAIPPDVANIIGLIRLGEAIAIIITAIIIRFALQLIPFTRLGS